MKSTYDKSWAVLIGIDRYQDPDHTRLGNAVSDARAVAQLLKDTYRFDEVHTVYNEDATAREIGRWLRDRLPTETRENDRVVFFFAGHGVTSPRDGEGYLVPYDAEYNQFADYVRMRELVDSCRAMRGSDRVTTGAKHVLLLLDCCFSGVLTIARYRNVQPLEREELPAGVSVLTSRPAWQIMTASADDELAADSGSRPGHSAFTGALLDGLEGGADSGDGKITAHNLAYYVREQVVAETRASQTPFYDHIAGSRNGDFVFRWVQPEVSPAEAVIQEALPHIEPPKPRDDTPGLPYGIELVHVPAGKFLMDEDKRSVHVDTFYIGKYPVTISVNLSDGHAILSGGTERIISWSQLAGDDSLRPE